MLFGDSRKLRGGVEENVEKAIEVSLGEIFITKHEQTSHLQKPDVRQYDECEAIAPGLLTDHSDSTVKARKARDLMQRPRCSAISHLPAGMPISLVVARECALVQWWQPQKLSLGGGCREGMGASAEHETAVLVK